MRSVLLVSLITLLTPLATAKGVYQEPEEFVAEAFAGQPPESSRVIVKGKLSEQISAILGHRYRKIRIPYWQDEQRSVWILEEIGKELPITTGFVISQDATIETVKVLIFRESRGWEVRNEFFTRQFNGLSLDTEKYLNGRIDNVTGATLSVDAIKKLSRLALLLHQHIQSTP